VRSILHVTGIAALVACSSPKGASYDCACEYITDTDGLSEQRVSVCAPEPDAASGAGKGCAQTFAPGNVQSCECKPVTQAEPCDVGACKALGD
jgi:hypothetical protein